MRAILVSVGVVLSTAMLVLLIWVTRRVLVWMVVAAFFAVALYPAVGWVERRFSRSRRSVATLLVFLVAVLLLGGLVTLFVVPLVQQGTWFAGQLPGFIDEARSGRGPVGELLERTNALQYVEQNQDRIRSFATGLTTPAAGFLKGVATGIAGAVTIFVLAYLMVLEGPKIVDGALNTLQPRSRQRVRGVGADCARSITGYLSGNLLISVICGLLTYLALKVAGVPFAALIALFVAIADLIPLVGATLGAVVAAIAAFIESVPAGIAIIVFFIVYQQLENHLLQPLVFARTVRLNPLTVVVAILVAVELAGILGALLAIPVASMIQVVARDLWDHRRGRPAPDPTAAEGTARACPRAWQGDDTGRRWQHVGMTVTTVSWDVVRVDKPDDVNVVIGQAHFIKTVEDLHEALVGVSPVLRFGLAFCEASGPRLVRRSGNDAELVELATRTAQAIAAGHSFVIFLRDGFPVNVLNPVKAVPEVCTIHCATANPVDVLVAVAPSGRGIVGVIDGGPPLGVETDDDVAGRRDLLRAIGYKL